MNYLTLIAPIVIGISSSAIGQTIDTAPEHPSSVAETQADASKKIKNAIAQSSTGSTVRMYVPDGQLKSHAIRVYISKNIELNEHPQLQLLRSHAVTKQAVHEAKLEQPGVVAPGQEWIEVIDGQQVRRSGTLMLFDLSNMDIGYKAMIRVMPIITWNENGIEQVVVSNREVNIGNITIAIIWTLLAIGMVLAAILFMSWRAAGDPFRLLTGTDGHLSLAQTQIACWTLAVGSVVLLYGLIRLEIPDIPSSLLALMGSSLVTGGVAFYSDATSFGNSDKSGQISVQRSYSPLDLIQTFSPGQSPQVSLAKAQMILWTMLLLILFISKSILDGDIWDVPWPLVALMGFSQAGYLAPKISSSQEQSNIQPQKGK